MSVDDELLPRVDNFHEGEVGLVLFSHGHIHLLHKMANMLRREIIQNLPKIHEACMVPTLLHTYRDSERTILDIYQEKIYKVGITVCLTKCHFFCSKMVPGKKI